MFNKSEETQKNIDGTVATKATSSLPGKKVFRLALYGVRGSGKTCILAALTLPRVDNPKGYTCTWIEEVPGHELPKGDPATWDSKDSFHLGWKWLQAQRSNLKGGELPEPNKASQETMRLVFDFGSKEHGRQQIELIDYSGELLTATTSDLAKNLREIMRDCDGLLILAEVPFPGRDQTSDAENLEKLKAAFCRILDERGSGAKADWPIALLFNKWDRRCDFTKMPKDSGQEEIKAFLNESPQPAQVPLATMIGNLVGEENTCCFPVSAFGAYQIRPDGMETPRNQGVLLNSFNLEDGFIWVAQKSDHLLLKRIADSSQRASWWAAWQLIFGAHPDSNAGTSIFHHWGKGVSPFKGMTASWHLMRRLSEKDNLINKARECFNLFALKAGAQCITFIFALLTFGAIYDASKYREVQVIMKNPSATKDQVNNAEAWLNDYAISPKYRHILSSIVVLSRAQAGNQLEKFHKNQVEKSWETFLEAKDELVQLDLVQKHLKDFPNSPHRSEAEKWLAKSTAITRERLNKDYLESQYRKIEAIHPPTIGVNDLVKEKEKLTEIFDAIGKLPYPEIITEHISQRQNQIRTSLTKKTEEITQRISKSDWEDFEKSYRAFIDRRGVAAAASALVNRVPEDQNLKNLKEHFVKNAIGIIKEKKVDAVNRNEWEQARSCSKLADDPSVVKLLPAGQLKEIQELKIEIDELEDKDLYDQILKYQPQCRDQVEKYLTRAPLKKMDPHVKAYKAYLDTLKGKIPLTLNLSSIYWDVKYYSSVGYNIYNSFDVKIQGANRISKTGVISKPGGVFADAGGCGVSLSLDDTVSIEMVNIGSYGLVFTSNFNGGKGQWTGSLVELKNGITVELKCDGYSNNATFTLDGFPSAPDLPPWMK